MIRAAFLIIGLGVTVAISMGATEAVGPVDGDVRQALLLERYGEPGVAVERIPASYDADDHEILARLFTQLGRYPEADSVLALHIPIGDDAALFFHALWRARLAGLAADYDKARTLLRAIEGKDVPEFAVYADFLRAESAVRLGHFEEAIAAAQRARGGDVPDAIDVALSEAMVDAFVGLERFDDAAGVLEAARGVNRGRDDTRRLLIAEFEFCARAGHDQDALKTAARLAGGFPRDASTRAAVDEVLRAFSIDEVPNTELIAFVEFLTVTGDVALARKLLRTSEKRRWSPAQSQERQLLRMRLHYASGEHAEAAALARKPYSSGPSKRLSTLYLARALRREGQKADAARVYEYFARTFPNDRKAAETLFVAAGLYDGLGDRAAGDRVRTQLCKSYPSSYHGQTVTIQSALNHARSGDLDAAADLLSKRVRRSRGTDGAAIFHLASVRKAAGDADGSAELIDQLREIDPYSFYLFPDIPRTYSRPVMTAGGAVDLAGDDGLLAFLERSDTEKRLATERIEAALRSAPGAESSTEFAVCMQRANWFLKSGLRDWAEGELESARQRCGQSPMATLELARVYENWAMPWRSVRLYQRVKDNIHWKIRREYDDDFRWLLYPTPFPVQILENAARYDLPPHLVYAMMREESRFDMDAVSRVGALGLMQLMPETGRFVARQMELPDWVDERLLEPEINLALGTWYAQSLLKRADGNPLWMLASYNAGPGNAGRWFDGMSDEDPRRVVEGIDFRETRGYVRRIVESANVYHDLYFMPRATSGSTP